MNAIINFYEFSGFLTEHLAVFALSILVKYSNNIVLYSVNDWYYITQELSSIQKILLLCNNLYTLLTKQYTYLSCILYSSNSLLENKRIISYQN